MKTLFFITLLILTKTVAFSQNSSDQTLPIGTIIAYAGMPDSVQKGWVVCDGSSLQIDGNLSLFRRIGWRFGYGDDQTNFTTFSLPDLSSRFLQGVGKDSLGQYGGVDHLKPDGLHHHGGSTTVASTGAGSGSFDGFTYTSNDDGHRVRADDGSSLTLDGIDHVHGIKADGLHDHGGEIRPLYCTVYYLMKIQ